MGEYSGIEVVDNCIPKNICDQIVDSLKKIDNRLWVDRNKINPNYGIKWDIGNYFSISSVSSIPSELLKLLNQYAPIIKGHTAPMEINETIVNRYLPGDFVPPHIDPFIETFAVCTIMLTEGNECFGYWPEGKNGPRVSIPDKIGRAVILHDMSTIHEVLPVQVERYSLIFNYF